MITINLKDFYPWYGANEFIKVPEEVALELLADKRYEAAYTKTMKRRKVLSFSDYNDKTQEWSDQTEPDPQYMAEIRELLKQLIEMLEALPEIQSRRIHSHIVLEMTIAEIATLENVSIATVQRAIQRGIKKIQQNFSSEG